MNWTTRTALAISIGMSAAALAWSIHRVGDADTSPPGRRADATRAEADADRATIGADFSPDRTPGRVEPLPQNVYHVVPYNDWPLFQISVLEGQRLKFRRVKGGWEGDNSALTIQFETPAEIDARKEDVEIAELEKQAAEIGEEVLGAELRREAEAAAVRERNARQEFERLEKLRSRTAASDQDFQRAANMLDLAGLQREQLGAVQGKKAAQARLQTQLAEHRLRRAQSEHELANFKRELSWGNVPHRVGQFEEVVVTKISAAIGDVPSGAGERKAWVEVIDDRVLQVRVLLPLAYLGRIRVGQPVTASQGGRTYRGEVGPVGIVADEKTQLVPALVRVENHDRLLKINTRVEVDFSR